MRKLTVGAFLLPLAVAAGHLAEAAQAGGGAPFTVAKAWSPQTITYRAPSPVPGSMGGDATLRPSAGRKLVAVEIVLKGAPATLKLPEIKLTDGKGSYEAVGSAGTALENFQPFSGFVSGWTGTFGPEGPDGPMVRIGRDKEADPIQFAFTGTGANLFLVFTVPADSAQFSLALGSAPPVPLKLSA